MANLKWEPILETAAEIVRSYDTGVTLRQLFYRLVAAEIPNTKSYYTTLSSKTAAARRQGWFPELMDRTRVIHRYQSFESPASAIKWLQEVYQRDTHISYPAQV